MYKTQLIVRCTKHNENKRRSLQRLDLQ